MQWSSGEIQWHTKLILKRLCTERPKDWDRYIPAVLFSYREVPQSSTGFSPFELLYGRDVRGPMSILKQLWTKDKDTEDAADVMSTYQYVFDLRDKIADTCRLVREELMKSSERYKRNYDMKSRPRQLKPGDYALVFVYSLRTLFIVLWSTTYLYYFTTITTTASFIQWQCVL